MCACACGCGCACVRVCACVRARARGIRHELPPVVPFFPFRFSGLLIKRNIRKNGALIVKEVLECKKRSPTAKAPNRKL